MAGKSDAAIAAKVETGKLDYDYICFNSKCNVPWESGAESCPHCGCGLMKTILKPKKG